MAVINAIRVLIGGNDMRYWRLISGASAALWVIIVPYETYLVVIMGSLVA